MNANLTVTKEYLSELKPLLKQAIPEAEFQSTDWYLESYFPSGIRGPNILVKKPIEPGPFTTKIHDKPHYTVQPFWGGEYAESRFPVEKKAELIKYLKKHLNDPTEEAKYIEKLNTNQVLDLLRRVILKDGDTKTPTFRNLAKRAEKRISPYFRSNHWIYDVLDYLQSDQSKEERSKLLQRLRHHLETLKYEPSERNVLRDVYSKFLSQFMQQR